YPMKSCLLRCQSVSASVDARHLVQSLRTRTARIAPHWLQLEYRLYKLLDGVSRGLSGCRVKAHMRIKLDAWVFVAKRLFGRGVDQQASRFFPYRAMAHSLATGNYNIRRK